MTHQAATQHALYVISTTGFVILNREVSTLPNHPTSDNEGCFFSNFQNYIPLLRTYVPASQEKLIISSSNNSFGVVPIVSPTLSLFHDDPYMKVMHAYYAKESPIPPPTIVPPSTMLSPMFNPQEFFLPMELLSPKKPRPYSNHSPILLPYLKNLRWEKALVRQVWNVTRSKLRKS
ncbi:hypothetical protein Tco_1174769 [Tanacetum coccineum]